MVLARTRPSNSALNSNFTLYHTLVRLNGGTEIVGSSMVPGGCSCLCSSVSFPRFRTSCIITISITARGLLNNLRDDCTNGVSLYVSRRLAGARCTGGLLLHSCPTTYRVVCVLVGRVNIGVSGGVTSYLCANVSASANYFECTSAATRSCHVTTRLVRRNTSGNGVGHTVFRAGAGACITLRGVTLGGVGVFYGSHITIVAIARSVCTGANSGRRRARTLTPLAERVRNIRVKVAVHRGTSGAYGTSVEACRDIGTTTLTGGFNNNNRTRTTTYEFSYSISRTLGRVIGGYKRCLG